METMTGLDAKFLYSETPTAHMHTVKVVVADVSALKGEFSYDTLIEILADQLGRLPPFRRRVVPVPWGLGHPVWVEDPEFDLKRHVSRRVLAGPAGDRELAAVVADFAGTPLARDRPLWELLVVEGLVGGRIAVVAKIHHAVADGSAVVALLQNVVQGAERRAVKGTRCGFVASRAAPDASRAAEDGGARPCRPVEGPAAVRGAIGATGPSVGSAASQLRGQAASSSPPHTQDVVQRVAHLRAHLCNDQAPTRGSQVHPAHRGHHPQRCLPVRVRRGTATLPVGPAVNYLHAPWSPVSRSRPTRMWPACRATESTTST